MEPALLTEDIHPTRSEWVLSTPIEHSEQIQVTGEIQGLTNYESYIFRFTITPITGTCAQSVKSDVYYSPNPHSEVEHVALLTGNILLRPDPDFLEHASTIDPHLRHMADLFFNPVANASKIHHPQLLRLAREPGGFFSIFKVEVKPSHRARDLGLQLLHQTLTFFRNKWVVAVVKPVPLSRRRRLWAVEAPFGNSNVDRSIKELKLRRHFSRLGFEQAGRDFNTSRVMFLTQDTFFPAPGITISWAKKDQVERAQFCMIREHKPRGIDKQLQDVILYFLRPHRRQLHPYPLSSITEIEVLLSAGASIHRSRALHIVAKQGADTNLLRRLLAFGANVNAPDESGNCPLHEAAAYVSVSIPDLVKFGACKNLKNNNNDTPFDILLHVAVLEQATLNLVEEKPEKDVRELTNLRNAVLALLPMELSAQLIDGCLSPRMHKLLSLTARKAAEVNDSSVLGGFADEDSSEWLGFCTPSSLLEYIPLRVLRRNGGQDNSSFMFGWACVFRAISDCLEAKQLPSVRRVRQKLNEEKKGEAINAFLDAGGKVEFALDAMISVTEDACKDKAEFWSYLIRQGEIETLVETPLDNLFNILTAMCLDGCGIVPNGPYGVCDQLFCEC